MPQAKLLIADDEAPVRTVLSAALEEFGYEVRTAEDGFSALAEIRLEVPDLLISDLHMPRMSGFELLSVVRRRFLRTFPQVLGDGTGTIQEANCVYCCSPIQYAIVQQQNPALPLDFQRKPGSGSPTLPGVPNVSF